MLAERSQILFTGISPKQRLEYVTRVITVHAEVILGTDFAYKEAVELLINSPTIMIRGSHWVVPHKFLAGEYPGDEDPVKACEKINRFLEAGIRHFVDLTEFGECEFVSYEPILSEESQAANITATYQRYPIRDISVPRDAEYLAEILLAIDRRIRQGGAVYVHCRGGVGRTGLVVACWLQEHGRTPDAALSELSAKWKTAKKSSGQQSNSPETREQVDWVKTWPRRRRNVQQLVLATGTVAH